MVPEAAWRWFCRQTCRCGLAQHLEKQFWGRALKIADLNADGTLELHEFSLLMQACALLRFCQHLH